MELVLAMSLSFFLICLGLGVLAIVLDIAFGSWRR